MHTWEKVKCWFNKNKKYIQIGGTVAVIIVGATVGYVLCNNKKVSFADWIKQAPTEDLEQAHKKLRLDFCKTGVRSYEMEQISRGFGYFFCFVCEYYRTNLCRMVCQASPQS